MKRSPEDGRKSGHAHYRQFRNISTDLARKLVRDNENAGLHKKSIPCHAQSRALSRYGVHLNKSSYRRLVLQIRNGQDVKFSKLTCSRSLVLVKFEGREFLLVYSKKTKKIITFLPDDDLKKSEFGKEE